ncbi:MAG TPA: hypothetical protein VLT33_40075 [Labilithrix sp.]|nr:hypothetical protein [Labilithrix sp.]
MQRASLLRWGVFASLGLVAIVGCAVGTDPEAGLGESDLTNLKVEAGDENSIVLPPPSKPEEDAATDEDTGTGEDAAAKADAATDAGKDSGTTTASCTSPNACLTATDLGSVSGDTGGDVRTFQGSGSQWLKVRVTENDSSVLGTELQMKAELQSPAGTNFDLFVYRAGGGSGQECTTATATSTSTGGFDSASTSWGEGTISNGSQDDRTITVEVRWVSGTCAAASKWTLTVRGNTL